MSVEINVLQGITGPPGGQGPPGPQGPPGNNGPHTHPISEVLNLQAELNARQMLLTAMADVPGLVDALADKSPVTHTHDISSVTGLQGQLDAKQALLSALADVPGLEAALAAKQGVLPSGTDGQVLTLASGVPGWADPSGGQSFAPYAVLKTSTHPSYPGLQYAFLENAHSPGADQGLAIAGNIDPVSFAPAHYNRIYVAPNDGTLYLQGKNLLNLGVNGASGLLALTAAGVRTGGTWYSPPLAQIHSESTSKPQLAAVYDSGSGWVLDVDANEVARWTTLSGNAALLQIPGSIELTQALGTPGATFTGIARNNNNLRMHAQTFLYFSAQGSQVGVWTPTGLAINTGGVGAQAAIHARSSSGSQLRIDDGTHSVNFRAAAGELEISLDSGSTWYTVDKTAA